jgi:hypothetical protein
MEGTWVGVDIATFLFKLCKRKAVYKQLFLETATLCPTSALAILIGEELIDPLIIDLKVAGVYVVFDGAAYKPKELTQRLRREPRDAARALIEDVTKRLANERWRGKEVELRLELNALRKDATAPDDRAYETLRAYLQDNLKVVCMRAAFELATQCVALHQGGKKRTNAVQAEWNIPLRKWIHKWKRAQSEKAIRVDPPSYEVMYECFCLYIVKSMSHEQDGG